MYSRRLNAQNPVFEIVHEERVKASSTHIVVKNSIGSVSVFKQLLIV